MQLSERIGRRINLRDLHILAEVVQSGSMSKAAKEPRRLDACRIENDR